LVIAILAPKWWMKALGLLHPLFTVSAIVATGNHWVLDAVGGATAVGLGFGITYALAGPRGRTKGAGMAAEPSGGGEPDVGAPPPRPRSSVAEGA
ncbi:hypothetical protein G3I76_45315, partial [Streptomyces sp. SID11233]|nr:hypothetical protein [Streptomyces sp. SID11233]